MFVDLYGGGGYNCNVTVMWVRTVFYFLFNQLASVYSLALRLSKNVVTYDAALCFGKV